MAFKLDSHFCAFASTNLSLLRCIVLDPSLLLRSSASILSLEEKRRNLLSIVLTCDFTCNDPL